jgi:thiol-disulfide isomerase/thioredoxin
MLAYHFFPARGACAVALALELFVAGCSSNESPSVPAASGAKESKPNGAVRVTAQDAASSPAPNGPITADGVLEGMAAAYRQAPSYADAGRVDVHAVVNGEKQEQSLPFSVTFERPNKLRLHIYQGNLISDGQDLRGWIDTQPGQPFHGQVLASEAPPAVSLKEVYADEILTTALTQGIAGSALQILLLLDEDPLVEITDKAQRPVLLEAETIDDRPCHRVLLARDDGKLVLWIDKQTLVLRRVEVPIEGLTQHLSQQQGVTEVKDVSVRMELAGARLGGKVDGTAFQFTAPSGFRLVKEFDTRELLPPAPPQLGKAAPEFTIAMLDGQQVDKDSLAGRIAVIDFWFTTCPPCRVSLPNLEQVYQKYKDNDLVRFVAVSVDESEVKDEALQSMFGELKVNVPIARDPVGKLAQAMGVSAFPTLIVLGADGIVENFEMGYNPQLATTLAAKLDRLLAGESIYKDVLKNEYRDAAAESSRPTESPATTEIPKAEIAPKSEPQRFKLTKLWTNQELEQPGNILVVADGELPTLFVNDGWKHVAELDHEGKLRERRKLEIPLQDVVAALRTTITKDGRRRFLGLASSQQQVHLFDDQWQKIVSYPLDRDHAGVADAQLADLDGDGQNELLVSYWGVVGVQGVSLEGQRLWGNRSLEHVFRLAVTGADTAGRRRVLCTQSRGTLVPINDEGTAGDPIAVGSYFLRSIYAAQVDPDGPTHYLAIASSAAGQDTAVGINLAGEEQWSHPLPRGVQKHPIEFVAWGDAVGNGQPQWLLAGPDGSLHILSVAGEVLEQFNYGAALSGLAVTRIDGKPVLLVATASGIDAWSVDQGAKAKPR